MLGRTNLFSGCLCPYYQNGLRCDRPYCHYKHEVASPPIPDEPTMVQEYIPSYSTTPTLHFQGYQGFFQRSNAVGELTNENCYIEQLPTNASILNEPISVQSYPSSLVATTQESTNINELAKNLASINNAIRELQDKLAAHKNQFGDLTEAPYDPEDVSSSHFNSYKPTPIQELEKMNGSKKRTHSMTNGNLKTDKSSVKYSTKNEPELELGTLVDDLVGANHSEKVDHADNNSKSKKRKSVSTFDLFGDESNDEDEDEKVKTKNERKNHSVKKKTIKIEQKSSKIMPNKSFDGAISIGEHSQSMKKPKVEINIVKSQTAKIVERNDILPDEVVVEQPKRLAHSNLEQKNVALLRQLGGERSRPKANFLTPREQLHMRFTHLQKLKEELLSNQKTNEIGKKQLSASSADSTVAGTARKGEKRVAHVPLKSTLKRPTIDVDIGSKVPTAIRQRYLNLFIDECMKFAKTEEEAFKLALDQEKIVFAKSTTRAAYLNSVVNAIKRLRDEKGLKSAFDGFADGQATSKTGGVRQLISHDSVTGGKQAVKCSFTVKRPNGSGYTEIKGQDFYDKLLDFVLSASQLDENGFPRADPQVSGRAVYKKDSILKLYADDENSKRSCCRCGIMFQINFEGNCVSNGDCVYHWGRPWKKKVAGVIESRYNCCQGDFNSKGCCVAKCHVTDTMPKSFLNGYYQTQTSYGFEASIYALDCEMIYTIAGAELARVTVVDEDMNVVYERVVKPECKVLDYNTRFSGLTEKEVGSSNISLKDIHEDLSKLFCAESILIGHSLESDLRALRIIHDRVVDTSVIFPHRMGPPLKRALKTLMIEYLQKIIQDDIEGHDSKEDACACMQLMKYKIKNGKK